MSLPRIAILASGTGTNAAAIIEAAQSGRLKAEINLVFSNRPDAKVLEKAAALHVPSVCLDHTHYPNRQSFDADMVRVLQEYQTDIVAMAGYMRLVTKEFLDVFPNRVLNIHPALLPAFKGVHALDDAQGYGVKMTGCTVHFVREAMDTGPIIIQGATPVMDGENPEETAARVHTLEHRLYPQALAWLLAGRLEQKGERHVFLHAAANSRPAEPCAFPHLIWPPLELPF